MARNLGCAGAHWSPSSLGASPLFSPEGSLTSYMVAHASKRPRELPVFLKARPGPGIATLPPYQTGQSSLVAAHIQGEGIWNPLRGRKNITQHVTIFHVTQHFKMLMISAHCTGIRTLPPSIHFPWVVHLDTSESQRWLLRESMPAESLLKRHIIQQSFILTPRKSFT